jgi:hypothetical protein
LEHLNNGRNALENTCPDYQDIFYLPDYKLSCTNAVKHSPSYLEQHRSTLGHIGYPKSKRWRQRNRLLSSQMRVL